MGMNKMNIPTKINVGFRKRSDTYNGKLAYVVYTDQKGVLRKEASWNSWRDKNIEPEEFINEPTSGFVLNKKVGGDRYGWNPRQTYVRIYDPRGFEFEITVPNLLFILEECSSIKGKGLEGEFVYAWDRADIVLLPVSSQEYVSSSDFTGLQTKKVTKNDMKEGCVYINKDTNKVMYLGRHMFYQSSYGYNYEHRTIEGKKLHVFVEYTEGNKSRYWTQTGFTKLATKVSDEVSSHFAEEYDKFKKGFNGCGKYTFLFEKKDLSDILERENCYEINAYFKKDTNWFKVNICKAYNTNKYNINSSSVPIVFGTNNSGQVFYEIPYVERQYGWSYSRGISSVLPSELQKEDLLRYDFYQFFIVSEDGEKHLI